MEMELVMATLGIQPTVDRTGIPNSPATIIDCGTSGTTDLNQRYTLLKARPSRLERFIGRGAAPVVLCNRRSMLRDATVALVENSETPPIARRRGTESITICLNYTAGIEVDVPAVHPAEALNAA